MAFDPTMTFTPKQQFMEKNKYKIPGGEDPGNFEVR